MLIIGCDYHPSFQQIAYVNTEGGELGERRLVHPEEAEQFYGELKQRNLAVRVGWKRAGTAAGLSVCYASCNLNCGLEMPPRFARSGCASRRPIISGQLVHIWLQLCPSCLLARQNRIFDVEKCERHVNHGLSWIFREALPSRRVVNEV